ASAVAVHAEDPSRRLGANQEVARLVKGKRRRVRGFGVVERRALSVRRDLIDDALFAGAGVDVSLGVDGQRPDVLLLRIKKRRGRAGAIDSVDLSVGRAGDV